MPTYRSRTTTHGRNMAGARSLLRATGVKEGDWDKPFIAICNSHVDIIPGHVHLQASANYVKECVGAAGGVPCSTRSASTTGSRWATTG